MNEIKRKVNRKRVQSDFPEKSKRRLRRQNCMMGALIRREKWDTYTKATFDAFERKDGVVAHTRNSIHSEDENRKTCNHLK
jgi:hypothetical protein